MPSFDRYGIVIPDTPSGDLTDEQVISKCLREPIFFVENFLGINKANGFTISSQQRELLEAVGALAYAKKMLWDAKTPALQERLRKETIKLAKKIGISVRSGRGSGKTSCSAWIILWFLCNHHNAKICCVGPTQDSLSKVLFAEINKWVNARKKDGEYLIEPRIRDCIELRADTIRYVDNGKPSNNWLVFQRVSSRAADEGQAAGVLGGLHESNLLVLFDEASAINDNVFSPLEQTLTGRCNIALLLFNPTRNNGYAYDTHFNPKAREHFLGIHWNTEYSELVSRDFIQTLKEKYGADSNEYRVSVLGEPPTTDESSLIPYIWIQNSIERPVYQATKPLKLLGVDVGAGGDATQCCFREGMKVHWFQKIHSIDMVEQALEVKRLALKYGVEMIFVDTIGVGNGLASILRGEKGFITRSVVVSNKPSNSKFRLLRDELWWRVREWFETETASIPKQENFRVEVSTIKYDQLGGKIVVEGKESIRRRLGRSCDTADSFLLTMVVKDWDAQGKLELLTGKNEDDYEPPKNNNNRYSWMGV